MRFWFLFPMLWWMGEPGAAAETPLTPVEAQAALQRARTPPPPAGFWRLEERKELKRTVVTTVTTEWREAGRATWRRRESETRRKQDGSLIRSSVQLTNAEGRWTLAGGLAVKAPELLSPEAKQRMIGGALEATQVETDRLKAEGRLDDPAARAEAMQKFMRVAGWRIEVPGQPERLRIRREMGPEGVKLMRQMVDEAWKQQKKQLSFGMRLLAGPIVAAKRDSFLPVKEETLIDAASGTILEQTRFNAAGKPIADSRSRRAKQAWKPVDPQPAAVFEIPAGMKRHHATSLAEFHELESKHSATAAGAESADAEAEDVALPEPAAASPGQP